MTTVLYSKEMLPIVYTRYILSFGGFWRHLNLYPKSPSTLILFYKMFRIGFIPIVE